MSKRKREIQKKKRLAEDDVRDVSLQTAGSVADGRTTDVPDPDGAADWKLQRGESTVDDSQIVRPGKPAAAKKKPARKKKAADQEPARAPAPDTWFGQNKENFLLGLLVFYVFLLGLGTMGELFEIEWILNLPLFK